MMQIRSEITVFQDLLHTGTDRAAPGQAWSRQSQLPKRRL